MNAVHTLALILVVAAVTQVTRWLPFWLFAGRDLPPWVIRLGKALPPAVMASLVVYCLSRALFASRPGRCGARLRRFGGSGPMAREKHLAFHRLGHGIVYGSAAPSVTRKGQI